MVDFGIGVSAGPVFAGNIGAENRYEYTVVGDAVNEAARLADFAKASGPTDRGFSGGNRSRRCRRACALGVGQYDRATRPVGLHPDLIPARGE